MGPGFRGLKRWTCTPARVPERNHFNRMAPNAIVEGVTNPGDMKATQPAYPSVRKGRADECSAPNVEGNRRGDEMLAKFKA